MVPYYYPYLAAEETKTERLNNLPRADKRQILAPNQPPGSEICPVNLGTLLRILRAPHTPCPCSSPQGT